jgi:hypothetical protein
MIYIGKGDIRDRMLAHFDGDNACIARNRPTQWVSIITANADATEKTLILEYTPTCNQKVG